MINGSRGQRSLWWEVLRLWASEPLPSPPSALQRATGPGSLHAEAGGGAGLVLTPTPEDGLTLLIAETLLIYSLKTCLCSTRARGASPIPVKPLRTRTSRAGVSRTGQTGWTNPASKPESI